MVVGGRHVWFLWMTAYIQKRPSKQWGRLLPALIRFAKGVFTRVIITMCSLYSLKTITFSKYRTNDGFECEILTRRELPLWWRQDREITSAVQCYKSRDDDAHVVPFFCWRNGFFQGDTVATCSFASCCFFVQNAHFNEPWPLYLVCFQSWWKKCRLFLIPFPRSQGNFRKTAFVSCIYSKNVECI